MPAAAIGGYARHEATKGRSSVGSTACPSIGVTTAVREMAKVRVESVGALHN